MVQLANFSSNFVFDSLILDNYVNLRSSIFSGDTHFYFGISLTSLIFSVSFVTVHELFCGKFLENSIILSPILFPIKSSVTSAVF